MKQLENTKIKWPINRIINAIEILLISERGLMNASICTDLILKNKEKLWIRHIRHNWIFTIKLSLGWALYSNNRPIKIKIEIKKVTPYIQYKIYVFISSKFIY